MKQERLAFWLFFGVFGFLLAFGLYLTHLSVVTVKDTGVSTLVWEWGKDKFTLKLTTGIPGLILVAMALLGYLALLVRVPVLLRVPAAAPLPSLITIQTTPQRRAGLGPERKLGAVRDAAFGRGWAPPPFSQRFPIPATGKPTTKKVPLLLYWLFYKDKETRWPE